MDLELPPKRYDIEDLPNCHCTNSNIVGDIILCSFNFMKIEFRILHLAPNIVYIYNILTNNINLAAKNYLPYIQFFSFVCFLF